MKRRALIVGSQTDGLTGVHGDVAAIEEALKAWGFATDLRIEGDATQAGILDGYRKLIAETQAGDAAVVYYSGHGGYVQNPFHTPGDATRAWFQFIVPTDIHSSGFRGLMDDDLSSLQAQLTDKTENVTTILDCCHAALMSRGQQRVKAHERSWVRGVVEYLERRGALHHRHQESNPLAVRLVACERHQSAYEGPLAGGGYGGFLTAALIDALREAKDVPVTWQALGMRVRERVVSMQPAQRPIVEGPRQRELFGLNLVDMTGAVTFFFYENKPALRCGRLLGSATGAVYGIMPLAAAGFDKNAMVAEARVTGVQGSISLVELLPRGAGEPRVDEGMLAYPISVPFERRPVVLQGDADSFAQLRERLKSNEHVVIVEEGGERVPMATVRARDGKLEVRDAEGEQRMWPAENSYGGAVQVAQLLTALAKGDALRKLENNGLEQGVRVTLGRVVDGERVVLRPGDVLHAGDNIYVDLENTSPTPVYVAVFDIGLSGSIALLTNSNPQGIRLTRDATYTFGASNGALEGQPISWSDKVPDEGLRRESLVVITTTEPQDFEALEVEVMGNARGEDKGPSRLERLMSHFRTGGRRDIPSERDAQGGLFHVRTQDFEVSPVPRKLAEQRASFLIDHAAKETSLLRSRSVVEASAIHSFSAVADEFALQLSEIKIHKNRAWFRTNVRVDTLVVTGGADKRAYRAATHHFPRVDDGDTLALSNLLVYLGTPRRFLDFSIWISRDDGERKELAELIAQTANDGAFRQALGVLGTIAVGPEAAAVVAGVAAAGTLGLAVDGVLRRAFPKTIGLYRTSFLARDAYGLGRHPKDGMIRAQDFSFRFSIQTQKGAS